LPLENEMGGILVIPVNAVIQLGALHAHHGCRVGFHAWPDGVAYRFLIVAERNIHSRGVGRMLAQRADWMGSSREQKPRLRGTHYQSSRRIRLGHVYKIHRPLPGLA
jgi:hypothetical protein